MLNPYRSTRNGLIINYDDPVNMVWHYHEFIQCNTGKMLRNFLPALSGENTGIVQFHSVVDDFSGQILPIAGTYGRKIGTGLRIIVTLQPVAVLPNRFCHRFSYNFSYILSNQL